MCGWCRRARRMHPEGICDVVAHVAVAVAAGPLAGALWRYKTGPAAQREEWQQVLAGLLDGWLAGHRECLAAALGTAFPVVTCVPSRHRPHPTLEAVLAAVPAGVPAGTLAPAQPLLEFGCRDRRTPSLRSGLALGGRTVLLLDDTWTTGATAQAAAAALHRAGAGRVVALTLGVHAAPGYPGGSAYLRHCRELSWDPGRCCLCAGGDGPGG